MALYTSGTTGRPKAVLHSHNSIHAVVRQIGLHWHVKPGDAFLVASPISHIGGSLYAFECPLLLGTRAVLMEHWDAKAAVQCASAERCTHMAAATPFLSQLLAAARERDERLPHLKVFVCGGASVPPSLVRQAADHFNRTAITRVYGSTEVPVTTVGVANRSDLDHAAETDGRIGVAELKLMNAAGTEASEGEIYVRGPQMFVGYLHSEDERGAFDAAGFYKTGDVGRRVDDHYLVITGRAKDIIIRNGENISPKEIEDVLVQHPGIAEVTIVGIPDARTGECACAVVVPRTGPPPDLDGIRAFLAAQGVATFKFPERMVVQESIPKNDAGKVLKHQVRADLIRHLQGA
jgi:acyl-CoA synthetase (AMP-forming)/AMP-acid ligase II